MDAILAWFASALSWVLNLFTSFFLAIKNFFVSVIAYAVDFLKDLPVIILSSVFDAIVTVFNSIPVPDFLSTMSLNSLFAVLPSGLIYFVGKMGIVEGLGIYAAGVSFRLMRKLFTLGQW